MSDHKRIYLQPDCCADYAGMGRLWCEDDAFTSECEENGVATEYIRADLCKTEIKRLEAQKEYWRDKAKDREILRAFFEAVCDDNWEVANGIREALTGATHEN